jgi:outer membrane protein OmpA-like peptidoglycan-associated protein
MVMESSRREKIEMRQGLYFTEPRRTMMVKRKQHNKQSVRVLALATAQILGVVGIGVVDAAPPHETVGVQSPARKPPVDCSRYDRCIALGKKALEGGDSAGAVGAFEQALTLAKESNRNLSEAYGNLALAHDAAGDRVAALAYINRARTLAPKENWLVAEYMRLNSTKSSMKPEDIDRQLTLAKQILQDEAIQTAAIDPEAEAESTPAAAEPAGSTDDNQGWVVSKHKRGVSMDEPIAMVEDPGKYAPKPGHPKEVSHREPIHKAQTHKAIFHNDQSRNDLKPKSRPKVHRTGSLSDSGFDDLPSVDLQINFEYDSAVLTQEGRDQADKLGKALEHLREGDRQAKFVILGHTDMYGGEQYNLSLSKDRAETVKVYLTQNFPVLNGSLRTQGAGMRYPISETLDEQSQRFNRRVEVKQLQ